MIAPPPPSPVSPEQRRAEVRTLHLRGSTTYACRRCRGGIRVVSAWYLPDSCPRCGASTWLEGRCECSGERRPGSHGQAFCHACGHGIWARVSRGTP